MSGMPLRYGNSKASATNEDTTRIMRIPTGVPDLDMIVGGGFPSGSVVLLLGGVGAGQQEYAYTSAAKIAIATENPHLRNYFLGQYCDDGILPKKICYVTFSRSKEDILREIASSFNPVYHRAIRKKTQFKDFSADYFHRTIVPQSWTDQEGKEAFGSERESLLESFVNYLDQNARHSLVIIDSLTDLVESDSVDNGDLIATMKGLQRAAKRWEGIVYLLLTKGIMEEKHQQMLLDTVDGVLVFEWKSYLKSSKRQRYMYVEKFIGVLPHMDVEKIARFPTIVTQNQGLTVVYLERIS